MPMQMQMYIETERLSMPGSVGVESDCCQARVWSLLSICALAALFFLLLTAPSLHSAINTPFILLPVTVPPQPQTETQTPPHTDTHSVDVAVSVPGTLPVTVTSTATTTTPTSTTRSHSHSQTQQLAGTVDNSASNMTESTIPLSIGSALPREQLRPAPVCSESASALALSNSVRLVCPGNVSGSCTMPSPAHLLHVVVAKTSEDVSWLTSPTVDESWPFMYSVSVMDETILPSARASGTGNRCNEAGKYLRFIVQQYSNLQMWNSTSCAQAPRALLFLHAHPTSYHRQAVNFNVSVAHPQWPYPLHLRVEQFVASGWGFRNIAHRDGSLLVTSADVQFGHLHRLWATLFADVPGFGTDPPPKVSRYCCAEFLVSVERVLQRPLEYYQRWDNFCQTTALEPFWSGRLFEDTWHVIFGQTIIAPTFPNACELVRCEN